LREALRQVSPLDRCKDGGILSLFAGYILRPIYLQTCAKRTYPRTISNRSPWLFFSLNDRDYQIQIIFKITELCPFDKNILVKLIEKDYSVKEEA
jgi:hypothetical protein